MGGERGTNGGTVQTCLIIFCTLRSACTARSEKLGSSDRVRSSPATSPISTTPANNYSERKGCIYKSLSHYDLLIPGIY